MLLKPFIVIGALGLFLRVKLGRRPVPPCSGTNSGGDSGWVTGEVPIQQHDGRQLRSRGEEERFKTSGPYSGLGFRYKSLNPFKLMPSHLRSDRGCLRILKYTRWYTTLGRSQNRASSLLVRSHHMSQFMNPFSCHISSQTHINVLGGRGTSKKTL